MEFLSSILLLVFPIQEFSPYATCYQLNVRRNNTRHELTSWKQTLQHRLPFYKEILSWKRITDPSLFNKDSSCFYCFHSHHFCLKRPIKSFIESSKNGFLDFSVELLCVCRRQETLDQMLRLFPRVVFYIPNHLNGQWVDVTPKCNKKLEWIFLLFINKANQNIRECLARNFQQNKICILVIFQVNGTNYVLGSFYQLFGNNTQVSSYEVIHYSI